MKRILNWGIIGPGRIARKFASDLLLAGDNQLYAVASRDLQRAKAFAGEFGAEYSYGSYEAILSDRGVDIVYIATPHHLHAELSVKALQAGKHVLCEKPAAVNAGQMNRIIKAADESGCFFLEGLWTRFNPCFRKVLEILRNDGSSIRYINADFCFDTGDTPSKRLIDPELAGGALLDIGIYPVFLAYALLGVPEGIKAVAKFSSTGVDTANASLFYYPDAMACLASSFELRSIMDARIYSKNSTIVFGDRWHEARSFTLIRGGKEQQFEFAVRGKGFVDEIEECYECIRSGERESPLWTLDDSMNLQMLLDAIRSEIGLVFPFE